ncbi:unnamed protein product [Sympodiomycopsis kandeliae]
MARSDRSDSTASGASFSDTDHKHISSSSSATRTPPMPAYRDDVRTTLSPPFSPFRNRSPSGGNTGSDEEEHLDEEEEVGLMQKHRDQHKAVPYYGPSKPFARLIQRRKGLLITVSVLSGLVLLIPILTFFGSSHHTPWSQVDVTIPGPKLFTSEIKPIPSAKKYKYSTNDQSGKFGIGNAPGFKFREEVAGWSTPSEADEQNGFPAGTTEKSLLDQGWTKGLKPITLDAIFNETFVYDEEDLQWSAEDPDVGVFAKKDSKTGDIILEDVTHLRKDLTGQGQIAKGGGKVTYVRGADVKDASGNRIKWTTFRPSPDMSHVLFFADTQPVWRYSKRHNVYVHDVMAKRTYAIGGGPHHPPDISHATWIPGTSSSVAYVQHNNLFVSFDPKSAIRKPIQVTNDGTETIFNAVTDWTYEEEVFATDHALWFSPNGTRLAYLRFDETKVPIYEYPIYNNDNKHAGKAPETPYQKWIQMKYPKPGFANPIVSAHMVDVDDLKKSNHLPGFSSSAVFDLLSPSDITSAAVDQEAHTVDTALAGSQKAQEERLITEVAWLDEDHLFVRETNRVSDKMRGLLYDARREARTDGLHLTGQVVRRRDVGETSWIEATQDMMTLANKPYVSVATSAYLEILPDEHGYRHIAFFANASASKPVFLTTGEWEVDTIELADLKRSKVYFSAGYPLPYRRHVLSVDLPQLHGSTQTIKPARVGTGVGDIIDLNADHPAKSFSANFDPKGSYYVLQEKGPDVPRSDVVGVDDRNFNLELTSNAKARKATAEHVKSQHVYYEVTLPDGVTTTTVQEIRPYDFDPSGRVRYPVLYNVYGGPNSQKVTHDWRRSDWHEHVANELGYIVAIVDGRGSGFRGKSYRDGLSGALGTVEISDLILTARQMRSLPYVDEKRMGIWGWSYGGYFTSKVIESDSDVITLGMAVAPVTDWRFYDSIYTERYMKSLTIPHDTDRYNNASVRITSGFRKSKFLLAHGTGDDNVHFQNSAHLIDLLTSEGIHDYTFKMFTDSNHRMNTRGAFKELYQGLSRFLMLNWGAGGKRRFEMGKGRRIKEDSQRVE